jgi:peptidoglycan hydrolase CwlO-like protein
MGVKISNKKTSVLAKEATKIASKIASLKFEFDLTEEEIKNLNVGLKGLKSIIERSK